MLTEASPAVDGLWMSVSALAKAKGKSKQAVSKQLQRLDGRVATRKKGPELLVNVVEFDRAVGETTDPAQTLRNLEPAGEADEPSLKIYAQERAKRESYQAENARLDLEERRGALTSVADVENHQMDVFRRVRDSFLALPATASEKVHAAPDALVARRILDDQIRDVLTQLAADLDRLGTEETSDAA